MKTCLPFQFSGCITFAGALVASEIVHQMIYHTLIAILPFDMAFGLVSQVSSVTLAFKPFSLLTVTPVPLWHRTHLKMSLSGFSIFSVVASAVAFMVKDISEASH